MSGAEMSIVQSQLHGIFAGCVCGVLLGALYDVFWLIRQRWCGAGLTFVLDLLFSMAYSAALFVLAVSIFQQRTRGFLLVSMLLGSVLWKRTAGQGMRRLKKWMHTRASARKFAKKP